MATLTATRKTGAGTGSPRVLYTSAAGAVSDADLAMASTSTNANTTDNTAVLQALIDQASATGAKIIWDGKYAHSGLLLKSNVHIEVLPGMGCWLRSGSDKPIFRTVRSFAAPLTFNVRISGMIAHGNPGGQTGRGTPQYGLNTGYSIYGAQNFILENFQILCHRTYAFHGMGIRNGIVRNGTTDYGGVKWENQDGVHFDGYCVDCLGENLTINSEDDAITVNADDAYRAPGWGEGWAGDFYYRDEEPGGPAKGITYRDIHIQAYRCAARVLSAGSRVDDILFENIYGTTSEMGLVVDSYQGFGGVSVPGVGNIGRITVRDWSLNVARREGSYSKPANTQFGCDIDQLVFENWKRSLFDAEGYPTLYFYTGNIKNVQVRGYVQRNAVNNFKTPFVQNDGATLGTIDLSDVIVERTGTVNASPVFQQTAGSFQVLNLSNITARKIHNVLDVQGGAAGIIRAAGITHTGSIDFTFASSVDVPALIASNVYSSATLIYPEANFANKAGDAFGATAVPVTPATPSGTIIVSDDFSSSLSNWSVLNANGGTAAITSGQLVISPASNANAFVGIAYGSDQAMQSRRYSVELVQALSASDIHNNTIVALASGVQTAVASENSIRHIIEAGQIIAQDKGASVVSLAHDPVAMRFLAFRVENGSVFWEYSANGTNWTSYANKLLTDVSGISFSGVRLILAAGTWAAVPAPGSAKFDNAKLVAL